MPSRAELELRAAAVNVDAASVVYANDSKLEQKVLFEEKNMTATTNTRSTKMPHPVAVGGVSGAANV